MRHLIQGRCDHCNRITSLHLRRFGRGRYDFACDACDPSREPQEVELFGYPVRFVDRLGTDEERKQMEAMWDRSMEFAISVLNEEG